MTLILSKYMYFFLEKLSIKKLIITLGVLQPLKLVDLQPIII